MEITIGMKNGQYGAREPKGDVKLVPETDLAQGEKLLFPG
jgi:hypothetical protein